MWTFEKMITQLKTLSAEGVLGFYEYFEVTEVFGMHNDDVYNCLTLIVAEEGKPKEEQTEPCFLNKRPFSIKGLRKWSFGICRYHVSLSDISNTIKNYEDTNEWALSGNALKVGALIPISADFISSNTVTSAHWNSILKNNFWNGSHLLELADPQKQHLTPFFENPPHLIALSEEISKYVPIRIESLSDHLGNIIIQIPVTIMMAKIHLDYKTGLHAKIAWHPKATPRPIRLSSSIIYDGTVAAYTSGNITTPTANFPMEFKSGTFTATLWDEENSALLTMSPVSAPPVSISLSWTGNNLEPRVFSVTAQDGTFIQKRIVVQSSGKSENASISLEALNAKWTSNRVYGQEIGKLKENKQFVQYKSVATQVDEHERALDDIRQLINEHGQSSVWIWDPYLNADDVLKTLFFCVHEDSELRALSGGKEIPQDTSRLCCFDLSNAAEVQETTNWIGRQRDKIDRQKGNVTGLKLEFRVSKHAEYGKFHDRFLIFPKRQAGAIAWSLGTSVNSLGRQHHILQKVSDGQMVADAFSTLWETLTKPEQLVWKNT